MIKSKLELLWKDYSVFVQFIGKVIFRKLSKKTKRANLKKVGSFFVAEKEGFEPPHGS